MRKVHREKDTVKGRRTDTSKEGEQERRKEDEKRK